GNHAQGVAHAAQLHGIPATIVMPTDAPAIKKANTRAYGATVVEYDRYTQSREEIADALVRESGAHLIRPYDDVRIIAGQGTVGLEIGQDCADRGIVPDLLLCNASGGGLIAGTAIATRHAWPTLPIWAVEPAGFDDMARSLASGRRERVEPGARSICDALLQVIPGEITFPINRKLLAGGLAISDDEALGAMATAFEFFKLVVEPGGAAALAAALSGRIEIAGRTVVVIASGGNVDPAVFIRALSGDKRADAVS
ncbi:MAG: pyridoxal-phosphate dependent enzyme, partial [Azospirillaceae bacterium]